MKKELFYYAISLVGMLVAGFITAKGIYECPYEGRECEPVIQRGFAYVREPLQDADSGTEVIAYPLDSFTIVRKTK